MQQLLPCHIFYHGSSILHHVCAQMSWLKVWVPGEGDLRVEGAIPAGAWYVEFQGILGPGRTGWAWVRDRSTNELWFLRHQPMQDARYRKKDVWSQYTWDWESWWKCFFCVGFVFMWDALLVCCSNASCFSVFQQERRCWVGKLVDCCGTQLGWILHWGSAHTLTYVIQGKKQGSMELVYVLWFWKALNYKA